MVALVNRAVSPALAVKVRIAGARRARKATPVLAVMAGAAASGVRAAQEAAVPRLDFFRVDLRRCFPTCRFKPASAAKERAGSLVAAPTVNRTTN